MTDTARTTIRCFVGLPLPAGWQRGLDALTERLAGRLASRISWTRPGNWHVTLRFLGEVEQQRLPEIAAALGAVAFAPFALRLGGPGFFAPVEPAACVRAPRATIRQCAPRTLWLGLAKGAEDCARLAHAVGTALQPCGFAPEARDFRAHVTLGRVKQAAADDWEAAGRELDQGIQGADFAPALLGEMVLWRSILGPQGPKYATLKSFPARDHGGCPDGRPA